jgi:hypothetical protein
LLAAFALGKTEVLRKVRRICADGALLEVVIGLDVERDRVELGRLGIKEFNPAYVRENLISSYRSACFEITETGELESWLALHTSWARRLQANQQRHLVYLIAKAIEPRR